MSEQTAIVIAVDAPSLRSTTPPASLLDLARSGGWKVHLVHAAGPDSDLASVSALLAKDAESFLGSDIDTKTHVVSGPGVDAVLSTAEAVGAAMIVVGNHGRAADSPELLSSFTSALLGAATVPVLVLPSSHPQGQTEFIAAVDRLIELIDGETDDHPLKELREAADAQKREPDSEDASRHLGNRLTDALHRFETEHPSLTQAINEVSNYLSAMGI